MCGISGFLSHDPKRPGDARAVQRMNDAIRHRGPDAEGLLADGPCVLGHRRLSIIDLSPEGRQPLPNEDGSVAVVVNGEIYNFQEIRDELVAKGHSFRSRSDSEVVVHLYEELGEACVARLHGMFALALWDSRRQRLLLARDRAGKKPLFYRHLREGVAFASEVHALATAFPDEPVEADLGVVDEYLTLAYVPSPRAAFKDTHKLPAAHYAVLEAGRPPRLERYWTRPVGPLRTESTAALADELLVLLRGAVRRRMVADVPLGAFLSGGVDSSTIVALMAEASDRPVKTFSIGFAEADYSEVAFARMVAKRFGTDHQELEVRADMVSVLPEIVRHHGEPFADSSAVATWYLSKMTREHVTVSLSGDAGDENFGGYRRYNTARIGHLYDRLPPALRGPAQAAFGAFGRTFFPYLGRYAARMSEGEAARYLVLVGQFVGAERDGLYGPRMRAARGDESQRRFERVLAASAGREPLGRVTDLDWHTYMIDDINVKVDIAAMAHALEVRCPFLDTAVVEFAAALPDRQLMHRGEGKRVLREAARRLLPAEVIDRKKMGFGIPLEHWFRHALRPMVNDLLLDRTARERGLFDPREVAALVATLDGRAPRYDRVWTLLMLELWLREFVDRA
ncbi:MAG: asnB 1 [Myxococcaceae bacterium]|nr:asnB 1 [Myxococcaceae bacterium]